MIPLQLRMVRKLKTYDYYISILPAPTNQPYQPTVRTSERANDKPTLSFFECVIYKKKKNNN